MQHRQRIKNGLVHRSYKERQSRWIHEPQDAYITWKDILCMLIILVVIVAYISFAKL